MAGLSTGTKVLLTISPCTVADNGNVTVGSDKFEVMLNPSSYTHEHSISYSQQETFGQVGSESKFSGVEAEKVKFDLVIDGTGVVDLPMLGGSDDVKTQIRSLNAIVYEYKGNNHEPSVVRLLWGSMIFFGRLESMSAEYTLFKPSGEPLRAKVKLGFVGFMSKEEESLRADRSSPDLSHRIEVQAGDTLPLLCYRIYQDSSYYPEVARFNNLPDFRYVEPGSNLDFPPLRSP